MLASIIAVMATNHENNPTAEPEDINREDEHTDSESSSVNGKI